MITIIIIIIIIIIMIMIMIIIARNALQCNYSSSLQTTLLNLIPCRYTALEIIDIFLS